MGKKFELNCEGLVCPMPVAKTKRKLLEMQSGDILEISGDFAEAGENIKRFIENNENEILEFRKEGENYFIIIKKS